MYSQNELNQGCIDDDLAISNGLSGSINVNGCYDAVPYLMKQGYSCSSNLYTPFLGSFTLNEICSCTCLELEISGCMDPNACNYDVNATESCECCIYPNYGYNCFGECLDDGDGDGICDEFEILGCTDENACNYNIDATDDDGSCLYDSDRNSNTNPIGLIFYEEFNYGNTGETLGSEVHIKNVSCLDSINILVTKLNYTYVDLLYFCFNGICFSEDIDTSPNSLTLGPLQTDDYFTSYLLSNLPGIYEVTYRFYLEDDNDIYQDIDISYEVNENTLINENSPRKLLINTVDILGRNYSNKGFQCFIYDDGSVVKKYLSNP